MPRMVREADITWEGNLARGAGAITAASGAFTGLELHRGDKSRQPGGQDEP